MLIHEVVYKKRLTALRRGRRYAYPVFALGLSLLAIAFFSKGGAAHGVASGLNHFFIFSGAIIASFGLEFFVGRTVTIGLFKRRYQISDTPSSVINSSDAHQLFDKSRVESRFRHMAIIEIVMGIASSAGGAILIGLGGSVVYGVFFILLGIIGTLHWTFYRNRVPGFGDR
jgi:hypothetical protein